MYDVSNFMSIFMEKFVSIFVFCFDMLDSIIIFPYVSILDSIIAINILLVAIPVLINSYSSASLERGASRDKKDSD